MMTRLLEQNAKMVCAYRYIKTGQMVWRMAITRRLETCHNCRAQEINAPGLALTAGLLCLVYPPPKMSIREMSDVIELAHAFLVLNRVLWGTKAMDGIRWSEEWRNAA